MKIQHDCKELLPQQASLLADLLLHVSLLLAGQFALCVIPGVLFCEVVLTLAQCELNPSLDIDVALRVELV